MAPVVVGDSSVAFTDRVHEPNQHLKVQDKTTSKSHLRRPGDCKTKTYLACFYVFVVCVSRLPPEGPGTS